MSSKIILCDISDGVAVVTINRPESLNSMDEDTLSALYEVFCGLENNENARAVIITGAGDKAFVAGGDIKSMVNKNALQAKETAVFAQKVFQKIEDFPRPVIACINGYALGGGLELAMACDIRVASESAKLGQPEIKIGIIPGFAGTVRLSRLVGKGIAKELIFTGDMIDAERAYEIGLVNKVVQPDKAMDEARAIAEKTASYSLAALKIAKEAVNHGLEMDSRSAQEFEANMFGMCFSTHDQTEGMHAFIEKRKAKFTDK